MRKLQGELLRGNRICLLLIEKVQTLASSSTTVNRTITMELAALLTPAILLSTFESTMFLTMCELLLIKVRAPLKSRLGQY